MPLLRQVQNADDNTYPTNVEPTLAFILQESGIVVLNNEQGFSAQNIRALCDVGNSTKKGSNVGYIGQKGIGFKSVFRVGDLSLSHTDCLHSNVQFSMLASCAYLVLLFLCSILGFFCILEAPCYTFINRNFWIQ